MKLSELGLQVYVSLSNHDGGGNGNDNGKKDIHVGLNVAKYHLGNVKFEQMQPAVLFICST